MSFIKPAFLFFFLPSLMGLYYLVAFLPQKPRVVVQNGILFAVSLFFYAWGEFAYTLVLLSSLVVNYFLAGVAQWWKDHNRSTRPVAWAAVVFNLALLVWFKYAAFLAGNISEVLLAVGGSSLPVPSLHLPLGISFFTFQAMSYVLDVCRGEVPSERSFLRFGVYVFLFPHLFAGPIVRYRDLAPQLGLRPANLDQFATGVRRFIIGLAKKLLLAETFAEVADAVFAAPVAQLSTATAWLGVVCFTLRIYFDFSGYSDMAIGLAKMFGFDFQENFHYPYIARSITDFWRRWHISLSSWFRDYLYIPLGGNRGGTWRTYRNLLIVFLLCGLWHGAAWTFLLWGLWHGMFLIVERLGWTRVLERGGRFTQHAYAILVVMLGWVLFRCTSVTQCGEMFAALAGFGTGEITVLEVWTNKLYLIGPLGLLACLPVVPWLQRKHAAWLRNAAPRSAVLSELALRQGGTILLALLLFGVMLQLSANTFSPFIYFRF